MADLYSEVVYRSSKSLLRSIASFWAGRSQQASMATGSEPEKSCCCSKKEIVISRHCLAVSLRVVSDVEYGQHDAGYGKPKFRPRNVRLGHGSYAGPIELSRGGVPVCVCARARLDHYLGTLTRSLRWALSFRVVCSGGSAGGAWRDRLYGGFPVQVVSSPLRLGLTRLCGPECFRRRCHHAAN